MSHHIFREIDWLILIVCRLVLNYFMCRWSLSLFGFVSKENLAHVTIDYEEFSNRSIWPIDRTLTYVATLVPSEPLSDSNKRLLPKGRRRLLLWRKYSLRIPRGAYWADEIVRDLGRIHENFKYYSCSRLLVASNVRHLFRMTSFLFSVDPLHKQSVIYAISSGFCFGLVSLNNDKPSFMGYLMTNLSVKKNIFRNFSSIAKVRTFPNGIKPKVYIIARVEFELAYYDIVVYAAGIPSLRFCFHIRGHNLSDLHNIYYILLIIIFAFLVQDLIYWGFVVSVKKSQLLIKGWFIISCGYYSQVMTKE